MRLLTSIIFLFIALNTYASGKQALIIDTKAFIKYSSSRYKQLDSYRDRSNNNYYYLSESSANLLKSISKLDNIDLILIDTLVGRRIKTVLDKLDINQFTHVIKTRNGKISSSDDTYELLNSYSKVQYFAYNSQADMSIPYINIGNYTKFYLTPAEAQKELSKLSKKNRKKYAHLYPTTKEMFKTEIQQNQNLLLDIFKYSRNVPEGTNLPFGGNQLSKFLKNDFSIKWVSKTVNILSESVKKIVGCKIIDHKSKVSLPIDDVFCAQGTKVSYLNIGHNGRVTSQSCHSTINNMIYKAVSSSLCSNIPTKNKWIIKDNQVQSCALVEQKNLIIKNFSNFSPCVKVLGALYVWNYSPDKKTVLSCNYITADRKAIIEENIDTDTCLSTYLSSTTHTNFIHDDNTIKGCAITVKGTNAQINSELDMNKCLSIYSTSYLWVNNQANTKVIGCKKTVTNTSLEFPNIDIKECVMNLKVDYYWEHKDGKVISCQEVTKNSPHTPIRTMKNFYFCENNSGVKYNFEKAAGKVTGCTKRSNWRSLLINTSTDLSGCLANLPNEVVTNFVYDKSKSSIKACQNSLKSGETLPSRYNTSCPFKNALLKDDSNDFIKGCFEVNPVDGRGINKISIDRCINKNNLLSRYQYSSKDKNVLGCFAQDPSSRLPILDLGMDLSSCRENQRSSFAWKGLDSDICVEFVLSPFDSTYYKVGRADSSSCSDNKHVLFDSKLGIYQIIDGNELDSNLSYQENLLLTQTDTQEMARELVDVFENFIVKIDRKVTTYNYRERKQVIGNTLSLKNRSTMNSNSKIAIDYANEWMDAIRAFLPDEGGMVGWGLYAASNPVESKEYGGSNWAMVAVDLPKHSKILDIRLTKGGEIPISRRVWELYTKTCGRPSKYTHPISNEKIYATVGKTELTKCKLGHSSFTIALKALGINAISYNWNFVKDYLNNHRPYVCDSSITNATFVIVETPLNASTVRLVVPEGITGPTQQELRWQTYINTLAEQFRENRLTSTHDSNFNAKADLNYLAWKRNNHFACHSSHASTDKVTK